MTTEAVDNVNEDLNRSDQENHEYEPDIEFKPVVTLPLVERVTLEEDEDVLIQLRAKLYRFDGSETPSVWKERGTGEIKLLYHSVNNTVRVVMRRDKTLKICANHFITPSMKLQRPNTSRMNWWMWSVAADFADEVSKAEIFAIKFGSDEKADLWKEKFIEGQKKIQKDESSKKSIDKNEQSSGDSSVSETDESFEDALDKSNPVTSTTDGLSESILKLDISK